MCSEFVHFSMKCPDFDHVRWVFGRRGFGLKNDSTVVCSVVLLNRERGLMNDITVACSVVL